MKSVGSEAETKAKTDAQKQAVLAAETKAADAQAKADAQKAAQAKKDAALAEKKRAADEAKAAKIQKQKMAEAEKQRADAEKAAESAASANNTGKELGLKPIAAPALPISAAKQEQLQALLAKYRADQITPAEYQAQRAEILAQP
jgi:colicin import membrane protein